MIFPCKECNYSFAEDEEYVACLLECARIGTADIRMVKRDKIRTALARCPDLADRIHNSLAWTEFWSAQSHDRVKAARIVRKLAMGQVAFELGEPILAEPDRLSFLPKASLTGDQLVLFEKLPAFSLLAEVGSRALQRQITSASGTAEWITVQPGRYRYLTHFSDNVTVRFVISEFLACEVIWDLSRSS
jgi:hypothetical protein